jgi:hypothetical protein
MKMNKSWWLNIGLLIVVAFLVVLIGAYFAPTGSESCYLNGQPVHGNLTLTIQHLESNSRAELKCP